LFTICAAAWLAKHGHLLNRLQLNFGDDDTDHAAEETAVAAALQEAAAGSRSGSLHITSCKLEAAWFASTAILQALPASKVTSLEFGIRIPSVTSESTYFRRMRVLGQAFSRLQQLRQLNLSLESSHAEPGVGRVLRHMSALTNLTSLTVPEVRNTRARITTVEKVLFARCCFGQHLQLLTMLFAAHATLVCMTSALHQWRSMLA
jgi:hypothetical protein